MPPHQADVNEPTGWLYTIKDEQDEVEAGEPWRMWTEPQHLVATGEIRRRLSDGAPYTPQWGTDDVVVIYHPDSKRCVMLLTLDGPTDWDETDELFWTDSIVEGFNRNGPMLRDIGVEKALQGGRHRLTPDQRDAAIKRMRQKRNNSAS